MNRSIANYVFAALFSLAIASLSLLRTNVLRIPRAIVTMPGGIVGILLSPQGAHGGREVDVIAFIVNLIIYFVLIRVGIHVWQAKKLTE